MSVGVGFSLQPDERFLDLLGSVLRTEPDYFEVAPETTWRGRLGDGEKGPFASNGFADRFHALGAELGKPFVAHGVGLSIGTVAPDPERRRRWLESIARDQARFDYRWYTDHLGASVLDGREVTMPMPVPQTEEAARTVRDSLDQLLAIVPEAGFENTAFLYFLGDPLEEPRWIESCLSSPRTHLLLDLHNLYANALNSRFDPKAYLDRLPLDRVIEIHVSGGSWSEPSWLPSERKLRLDSHDGAVPEEVWSLLEVALPRCRNLRGVTLERMHGTVEEADVRILREELRRARTTLGRRHAGR